MKSKHRHELETNVLAQRLAVAIDRFRPYASTVIGVLVAAIVLFLGISYYSGASAARETEAWDVFNRAVEGWEIPDLDQLRKAAEEYPGTNMQQWADITWADGQVWMASRAYIQNRDAAMAALNRAASTYQSLLQETDDERLVSRARFGLGRVYELRNQPDRARDEYLAVQGSFAVLAKQRAEKLAQSETKEMYDWLATAEPPLRAPPSGPGVPGQRPEFTAGELDIPEGEASDAADRAMSIDELFRGLTLPEVPPDRYETEEDTSTDGDAPADAAVPEDEPANDGDN